MSRTEHEHEQRDKIPVQATEHEQNREAAGAYDHDQIRKPRSATAQVAGGRCTCSLACPLLVARICVAKHRLSPLVGACPQRGQL
jgi:hypothetical protein